MNDAMPSEIHDERFQSPGELPSVRMDPAHTGSQPCDGTHSPRRANLTKRLTPLSPPSSPSKVVLADTVLIVDDSAIDRRIASHLIEHAEGLALGIATAGTGREAMNLMEESRPVIVLADLQLPDMDGLDLVRSIRERHLDIPVVVMTAHGSEEIAVAAIKAGAVTYVPKKLLRRELCSTLQRILEFSANEERRQRLFTLLESRETRFCLGNDADLHAPLVGVLQDELRSIVAFDPTTRIRIGVAIQEALNNALYHGNLEVSSELRQDDEKDFHALADARRRIEPYGSRKIHVHSRTEKNEHTVECTYIVRDEGPGFDTTRLDRPFEVEDLLKIGGRGLLLIRAFMDEVSYNESGNEITMIKREIHVPAS